MLDIYLFIYLFICLDIYFNFYTRLAQVFCELGVHLDNFDVVFYVCLLCDFKH